jgi:multicomponent Na+:H+ antiporter subunit D
VSQTVVAGPVLLALVTALATLLARPWPRVQQGLSLLGTAGFAVAVALLGRAVATQGALVYQLSGWPAPFGISLVADALAVFVLGLAATVSLAALPYSVLAIDPVGQRLTYHPLYHFMFVGVAGAVLTGDIFNLFVWFEVMLMPSYVLVVWHGGPAETRAALQYTVLNLFGSALMLLAIGGLYATTGTLNMADLARRLADPAAYGIDPLPVMGLAGLLLTVFALKAGLVPFQFWVPAAYRAAPAPVTAVLAGVTKKVGVYAIIRLLFTVLGPASLGVGLGLPGLSGATMLGYFGPVLFLMATASIVIGGLGAVSAGDLDTVLAHSSIGQVGFIVLPLAVGATVPAVRELAIVAALLYALNHAIAKGGLYLLSGAIRDGVGTDEVARLGGLAGRAPVLSGAFLLGSFSLIGIPPLTGFFGKFVVFDVAGRAFARRAVGGDMALVVALLGAVLTIAYLSRAWNLAFWGEPSTAVAEREATPVLVAIAAVFTVLVLVLGVGFDPLYRAATQAAQAALDQPSYVDAVAPAEVAS